MANIDNPTIPKGALVVVTGANGFIASHVVDQFLLAGYRVRGTVRSISRTAWMQTYFDSKYGKDKFSLFEVPAMSAPHAFDEVVKGVSGIAHVATPVMQSFDPNEGVPIVVDGALNALKAAAKEPSVKCVVMTSSSTAAATIKDVWAPPPYEGLQRRLDVYSVSKMQAEQAAWKFMCEEKPVFVLNTILPNANMGPILSIEHQGYPSTAGWVKALWNGFEGYEDLKFNPPQYYINVQDNARVHVAALLFDNVKGKRLFTFAKPYTWNNILAVFHKSYPERKFIDDIPDLGQDLSKVANQRAEELLKRLGRPGWASLEESVRAITETLQ